MSHRFVRCPHCKMPHDAAERVCPNTGLRLSNEMSRAQSREQRGAGMPPTRMSEIPPPERRPEPLGFGGLPHRTSAERNAQPREQQREQKQQRSTEPPGSMPPTRDLQRELLGQTVGGRYRIKGILGEGGMGTVYDAEHLGLSRQVAIKVLSPSQAKKRVAVKRFQQEARAAGAIGHPNICEVYDLGLLDDGSPYLVMEKLVGQTLAERIAKEGGLPFDEVVEVIVQVLSGLIAAHEKGIVHRDIKPENIFLARRLGCPPIIKLLDFGVSKMMVEFQTGGEDHLDLTRTGMVMGTPYYMSPEQARGERNLDGRVDVYACGVVMYEAIVGKRPFLAPNYNALLLAIINTTPRPIREIRPKTPPELEAIIAKAMAKNRDDRFITAKEFLRQLTPQPQVPAAEGSGSRLPAPPTAEERKRAPVLGGRAMLNSSVPSSPPPPPAASRLSAPSHLTGAPAPPASVRPPFHEPLDRPDGPSATLRSRMAEAAAAARNHDRSTRLDVRHKQQPPQQPAPQHDSDDSIDIPIHVTAPAEEEDLLLAPLLPHDEEPTEIFRPGKHPQARPAPRGGARATPAARRAPAPAPASRRAAAPVAPPPEPLDDWEGETIVKRPEHAPPASAAVPHTQAALAATHLQQGPPAGMLPRRRERGERPFNPDETMKLENTGGDVAVDPRAAPRRPQR